MAIQKKTKKEMGRADVAILLEDTRNEEMAADSKLSDLEISKN